jgi:hypothetical protein
MSKKHITDQLWRPLLRHDGLYLVGQDDGSMILKLCRPDDGSDTLLAGYICALQAQKFKERDA